MYSNWRGFENNYDRFNVRIGQLWWMIYNIRKILDEAFHVFHGSQNIEKYWIIIVTS